MSEYENWARKQAAENEAREKKAREREATRRFNEEQHKKTSYESVRAEAMRELKGPSDKLEGVLRDALRSEFGRAKQSRIMQKLDWIDDRYVYNSSNKVQAQWGEQLEIKPNDKALVEGKSSFFKNKPLEIPDHRYYSLDFSVGYREITLLQSEFGSHSYPKISREDFDRDFKSVYPLIQLGLNKKKVNYDYWVYVQRNGNYMLKSEKDHYDRLDTQDA